MNCRQRHSSSTRCLLAVCILCVTVVHLTSTTSNPHLRNLRLRPLQTIADKPVTNLQSVPEHDNSDFLMQPEYENPHRSNKKCLEFESEQMDQLISNSNRVFITMPAKAAGTSLKSFANQCTKTDYKDNFPNWPDSTEEFLTHAMNLPKIIASHSLTDQTLVDLIQHSSRGTLLIHVYRDETDRLVSGIKEVVTLEVCRWTPKKAGVSELNIADDNNNCMIDELSLVEMIKTRRQEIGYGNPETLTCRVYDTIDDNAPTLVFMSYKQANKLQATLAKHHCPELQQTVETNTAQSKHVGEIHVRLNRNKEEVTLNQWLESKADLLEWALKLNGKASCRAKTRRVEENLLSCRDEMVLM